MPPTPELFTPAQAAFIAQDIQRIARVEAIKAVAAQGGAHREYVWMVYDPEVDPLVVPTYNIGLACEPVDFVVTYGRAADGSASYAPSSTGSFDVMRSTNGGASWSAMTSTPTTVGIGTLRGVGAVFNVSTLQVGDMVTMRMNSGGGGLGIVGQLRVRRVGEHTRTQTRGGR